MYRLQLIFFSEFNLKNIDISKTPLEIAFGNLYLDFETSVNGIHTAIPTYKDSVFIENSI